MGNIWRRFRALKLWQQIGIGSVLLIVVLAVFTPSADEEPDDSDSAADTSQAVAATTDADQATAEPTEPATEVATERAPDPTPEPTAESDRVGDGTWLVGSDITAGRYRTTDASGFCYWARLSGLSGDLDDVMANDVAGGEVQVVDVLAGDRAFETQGCGTWAPLSGSATESPDAPFGDGTWIIGQDVSVGTWRAQPESVCYWARLTGFDGDLGSILANDLPTGSAIVEIQPGDVGFGTRGCGEWTKLE